MVRINELGLTVHVLVLSLCVYRPMLSLGIYRPVAITEVGNETILQILPLLLTTLSCPSYYFNSRWIARPMCPAGAVVGGGSVGGVGDHGWADHVDSAILLPAEGWVGPAIQTPSWGVGPVRVVYNSLSSPPTGPAEGSEGPGGVGEGGGSLPGADSLPCSSDGDTDYGFCHQWEPKEGPRNGHMNIDAGSRPIQTREGVEV